MVGYSSKDLDRLYTRLDSIAVDENVNCGMIGLSFCSVIMEDELSLAKMKRELVTALIIGYSACAIRQSSAKSYMDFGKNIVTHELNRGLFSQDRPQSYALMQKRAIGLIGDKRYMDVVTLLMVYFQEDFSEFLVGEEGIDSIINRGILARDIPIKAANFYGK